VAVAGTVMPRELFNENLEAVLEKLSKENTKTVNHKKRIMVAGSINDDIALIKLIEDAGSTVVSDSICFGIRSETDRVDTTEKPVAALAKRYLSNSVCPRMFGAYRQRFDFLREKAKRAGVEGIILQNIRFCDLHGSESGLLEKDFEKIGIPCLRIEREYGPLTETGRIKMRIEAFFERIS
jgi:benzoyl-CoA reductase/2-hydroxyglutaryl-CoA dehydratase subunit BcrC/BadD/HgdB